MSTAAQRSPLVNAHRILCVDDEPQILEGLALTLGRRYQVEMAPSGMAALEILRARPDTAVIISDMRMPSMNGAQFLAASRKIVPHARRIILTGYADTASAIAAVNEAAIFRFLTKPCPFATLLEAVEAAIADFEEDALERSAIRRNAARDLLRHDALTGLASRDLLLERLDLCRGGTETEEWRTEVVFVIEVSGVEDPSTGYDSNTADRLLRWYSAKLHEAVPAAACLARHREATFAVLVSPEDSSDAALKSLAARIVEALEQPVDLDGIILRGQATVGIARIPAGSDEPRSALRHAELAAREAKRHGGDPIRLFSPDSVAKSERRRETIQALRVAVAQQQFRLCYQPIIDLEHHQVYSLEALARWEHAQLGFVPPTVFIPLAEETGLMISLGEWVMKRACADARNLCGPRFPRVSVNVSVAQILDSRFMDCLYQAIETSGVEPFSLELELTETVFAEDLDRVSKLLSDVRLLGVSVAIDDFGAGYSSLAYLARLPVDVLKIDRIFVQHFDLGGEAIIRAALSVAQTLNIEVVVEGIETAAQLERVRDLGATKVQGFFFAQPMPAANLLGWHQEFESRRGEAYRNAR
jgi:predicted signal transduction protein with EAL and GGDEF domain